MARLGRGGAFGETREDTKLGVWGLDVFLGEHVELRSRPSKVRSSLGGTRGEVARLGRDVACGEIHGGEKSAVRCAK